MLIVGAFLRLVEAVFSITVSVADFRVDDRRVGFVDGQMEDKGVHAAEFILSQLRIVAGFCEDEGFIVDNPLVGFAGADKVFMQICVVDGEMKGHCAVAAVGGSECADVVAARGENGVSPSEGGASGFLRFIRGNFANVDVPAFNSGACVGVVSRCFVGCFNVDGRVGSDGLVVQYEEVAGVNIVMDGVGSSGGDMEVVIHGAIAVHLLGEGVVASLRDVAERPFIVNRAFADGLVNLSGVGGCVWGVKYARLVVNDGDAGQLSGAASQFQIKIVVVGKAEVPIGRFIVCFGGLLPSHGSFRLEIFLGQWCATQIGGPGSWRTATTACNLDFGDCTGHGVQVVGVRAYRCVCAGLQGGLRCGGIEVHHNGDGLCICERNYCAGVVRTESQRALGEISAGDLDGVRL